MGGAFCILVLMVEVGSCRHGQISSKVEDRPWGRAVAAWAGEDACRKTTKGLKCKLEKRILDLRLGQIRFSS